MAIQTERAQFDGSINVDGSIFQYGVEFTGGSGGGGTGDVGWANGSVGSNNQVITAAGDGSIVAESNLTFNGSVLDISGDVSTSGKVGIGVAPGTPRLHVRESDSGGTPTSIATMAIEKNDNAILQFMTPNNQSAMIWFGDPDGANRGYIDYDHDGDFMTLQANANTNQLVLNADGTVSFSADVSVGGKVYSTDGYETGNFEIVHNTTSDSLDFNYIA